MADLCNRSNVRLIMLDTQPLITAERTELQCDVVWATSGGPAQLISEYQPVIATEGRARGGNGQMGDIRARMTLLLPCAVIVAVLLDHGRLGMAVAGRCGVRPREGRTDALPQDQ